MLSVIVTVYNQPAMLARQASEWRGYPQDIEVIVVDDGGRIPAKADGCRIYRVTDDIPWHQDGARNLGAHVASNDWLLFLDADHVLPSEAAQALLQAIPGLEAGSAYRPLRKLASGAYGLKSAANIWLMRRDDFWRVGGYDERLCGTYGTDLEFRPRLRQHLNELPAPVTLDVYTSDVISDSATSGLDRKVVKPPKLSGDPVVLGFDWVRVQ